MSWYASGYGEIVPKGGSFSEELLKELADMGEFEIFSRDDYRDGKIRWFISYDGNFHSDYAEEYLRKLAPYVESGDIEMSGEEETFWKYVFTDGAWGEVAGRITYDDERYHPLCLENSKKLEFLNDIITVFENFLEDKGIEIENPDKEQSENPSNIYGVDYGDMESEIECVLRRWKVLA